MSSRITAVGAELRNHAPFTLFGAVTGIALMLLLKDAGPRVSHGLFMVFHPGHVLLSAIVTTSLFRLYEKKTGFLKVMIIGYLGAVGVATLSDSVLPFFGESLLGVAIPTHGHLHQGEDDHDHEQATEGTAHHHHEREDNVWSRLHLGFIEDWYLVNPAALLGILIAWFFPRTRFPHAGHVLLSTWASSFHMLMHTQQELTGLILVGVLVVLFIAVWLPCCISDIVFPMLFVKSAPLCLHHNHKEEPCS